MKTNFEDYIDKIFVLSALIPKKQLHVRIVWMLLKRKSKKKMSILKTLKWEKLNTGNVHILMKTISLALNYYCPRLYRKTTFNWWLWKLQPTQIGQRTIHEDYKI